MKNSIIGLKDLRENMDNYISQIKKGKCFVKNLIYGQSRQISKQIRPKRTKGH